MNSNSIIETSGTLSLLIQIVTTALDTIVLLIPTKKENDDIRELLKIENVVNVIEGIFYIWMVCNFNKIKNITKYRYYDWMFTTPTMLFTYIMYNIMTQNKEKNIKSNLMTLVVKEKDTLLLVMFLNWLMLFFGYLNETGEMGAKISTFLGFIPFFAMFYIIYDKYAKYTDIGRITFFLFAGVWALYGVAALMSYNAKNAIYNILDLFSKNFFGLFLAYMVVFR